MFNSLQNMYIGYWKENIGDGLPVPVENTATPEQVDKMLKALEYFKNISIIRAYKGASNCRICNCQNGSEEHIYLKRGKMLQIPKGIEHYIKDHKVLIPELFNLDSIVKSMK